MIKKIIPKEADEQKGFINYLKLRNIKHNASMNENIFSGIIRALIPNKALATRIICSIENKSKSMGKSKGYLDVEILKPTIKYHGFFIEFKRKENKLTAEQKVWKDYLNSVGYKAIICYDLREAIEELEIYLKEV